MYVWRSQIQAACVYLVRELDVLRALRAVDWKQCAPHTGVRHQDAAVFVTWEWDETHQTASKIASTSVLKATDDGLHDNHLHFLNLKRKGETASGVNMSSMVQSGHVACVDIHASSEPLWKQHVVCPLAHLPSLTADAQWQ
eukprot:4766525-Pyramimonas_sp.AAC.1